MTDATWPTEAQLTAATNAAAADFFDRAVTVTPGEEKPSFDDLPPTAKLQFREAVLPIVWAALNALPDPRHTAWLEGCVSGGNGLDSTDNPYPTGGTDD